ncbi:MAG TPA: MBL fold metallo-hydrolase [Bacteroidia bacterium]|nr:MBL fold metallo-hydrolase [Bacteroidia bacterium]
MGTGTSQGVPVIGCKCRVCTSQDPHDNRLRSSVMVSDGSTTIVIDSGPDFRQQMLREKVERIDGLVFTHEHKDHIAGMDDIRAFNYVTGEKVNVYATLRVQMALKREFPYVFDDFKYPGVPEINLHTIDENPFSIGSLQLTPLEVLHYRLPVFGFRIEDFSYVTDANFIPDTTMKKLNRSKVFVLNALRREPHVSHYTLEQALEIMEQVKPDQGYLTHISHQLGKNAELNDELPPYVSCAYDGLTIEI